MTVDLICGDCIYDPEVSDFRPAVTIIFGHASCLDHAQQRCDETRRAVLKRELEANQRAAKLAASAEPFDRKIRGVDA